MLKCRGWQRQLNTGQIQICSELGNFKMRTVRSIINISRIITNKSNYSISNKQ